MPIITPGAGGGGGATPAVRTATLTLSDAQIKTLPTDTSRVIVAAQGAGTVIIPVWAAIICDTSAGAYSNFNNAATIAANAYASSVYLAWDAPTDFNDATGPSVAGVSDNLGNHLLDSGFRALAVLNGVSGLPLAEGPFTSGFNYSPQAVNVSFGWDNVGLYVVGQNNGLGNFTGGNAANTLTVTVTYYVAQA